MTALSAYGLILLSSLGTALCVWIACHRWYAPRRLPGHDGWLEGYEVGRGSLNWAERMEMRKRVLGR